MANSTISSGEVSNSVLGANDKLYVYEDGLATETIINNRGNLLVSSGGSANGAVVNSGGSMSVFFEGKAGDIVVSKGAVLSIASGGEALAIKEEGGIVSWSSGVTLSFVPSEFSKYTYSNESATIHSGTTANSTTLGNYGRMYVYNGGLAAETTINNGGDLMIYSGGSANGAVVNSGGGMSVFYEGKAGDIVVSKGAVLSVASGGEALAIKEEGGIVSWSSGATLSFVPSEFSKYTYSNESATIHSGTTANSTTLGNYGRLYVYNGGLATETRINNGGDLMIYSGGSAGDTVVNSGGGMSVFYEGKASDIVVSKGAVLSVASGGEALAIKEEGGIVTWSAGATLSFVPSEFSKYTYSNESATIHSGTTANSTTLGNYGRLYVYNGGLATETRINNSGDLMIYSGGSAGDTVVNSGGGMSVFYEGKASDIVVSKGAVLFIESGGEALAIKEEGGIVTWSSGVTLSFVPSEFSKYTYSNESATIHSGTTANSTTLGNYGRLYVYNGGLATETRIDNHGLLMVYSGGAASDTVVNSNGMLSLNSAGLAIDVLVSSGGSLTASSGTMITGSFTIINGAKVSVLSGSFIDFDLTRVTPGASALVSNLSLIGGAPSYSLTVNGSLETGNYVLAGGASGFSKTITVFDSETFNTYGTVGVGESIRVGNLRYSLNLSGSDLTVSVVEVPPDYVLPTVKNIKASTSAPTNQNVIVTAEFDDDVALASSFYKVGLDGEWKTYTNGVTVTANSTVYFQALDAAGNYSEIQKYEVSNIDREPPDAPTASANITEMTSGIVTVSAVFSADSVAGEYSFDGSDWEEYTTGVEFLKNGKVYFRGIDEAGNASEITSFSVNNIEEAESGQDLGFYWVDSWDSKVMVTPDSDSSLSSSQTLLDHDYLYLSFATVNFGKLDSQRYSVDVYLDGDFYRRIPRYSLESNKYETCEGINIGSFGVGFHDIELAIVSDDYDEDPSDNTYKTWFYVDQDDSGSFLKGYYGGNTERLDNHTSLSLKTGKYVIDGNFIGSQLGRKVNAKILVYNSRHKKVATIRVKKGKVAYKELVLASDTYRIEVISTDKQKTADRITFDVTGEVYYKADLNDNSISDVKDLYPFIATVKDVPRAIVSDGWVGFGDVLSFRQIDFEFAGKYTFTVNSTDKVKVTLVSVSNNGKGRTKEKKVASITVKGKKIGKDINFGGKLLNGATYYLRVEALSAAKGTNADYSVKINSSSVIFSNCDGNGNDWLYEKGKNGRGKNTTLVNSTGIELVNTLEMKNIQFDEEVPTGDAATGWCNFVGYDDPADYQKLVVKKDNATASFKIDAKDQAKFVIYSYDKTTNRMKALQTSKLKKDGDIYTVTTNQYTFKNAADYYIAVISTNAKKGGNAYYNVTLVSTNVTAADILEWKSLDMACDLGMQEQSAGLDFDAFASAGNGAALPGDLNLGQDSCGMDPLLSASADSLSEWGDQSVWQNIAKLA